ncbi:MAG: protein-glutamate O-methyltransferase CheR [Chloroflexi bacterium]|nr:MAG: protein-glutamate O-methyltransferase CheR [Chloroflexota bacterium]
MTSSALALTPHERSQLLELVDHEFGIRGSEYGASRLDDAVNAILPESGYASPGDLLASCVSGTPPRWLYRLVEYLTVGETYFFRDPAQIAALRETILPDLVKQRWSERRLRVWSAGCSTGEETYTLAILLRETLAISGWDVQLVGTDVNRESLRHARDARYAAWSFRATPDPLRDRYFEPIVGDSGWRLIEPIRRMARFTWMNLGAERIVPPAAELDLVVCRNVTIYFDEDATQRLYRALVAARACRRGRRRGVASRSTRGSTGSSPEPAKAHGEGGAAAAVHGDSGQRWPSGARSRSVRSGGPKHVGGRGLVAARHIPRPPQRRRAVRAGTRLPRDRRPVAGAGGAGANQTFAGDLAW